MPGPSLFLIDTMSQVYRAFFAIPTLSTADDFPTNALYGFVSMLNRIVAQHHPDYMAAAAESRTPTRRHEAFSGYKATRKPMPPELALQLPFIDELCAAFRVPILQQDGFEADDILATLADRGRAEGFTVSIVTSDKDMYQLVDDRVTVLDTKADIVFGPQQVLEKMGVKPAQVVDLLALMGDTSDNIPGAPGIGPVNARKLLNAFGDLDACYRRLDEVEPKRIREILRQHRQQVLDSRALAMLDRRVPVQWEWAELRTGTPDLEHLRDLFTRFGFRSLLKELPSRPATAAPTARLLDGGAELRRMCDGQPLLPVAMMIWGPDRALAQTAGDADILSLDRRREQSAIQAWLERPSSKRFHGLKRLALEFELPAGFEGHVDDAELIHYLLWPHIEDHSLERIALELSRSVPPATEGESLLVEPLAARLEVIHAACAEWLPRLEEAGLGTIYREVELPLLPILAGMERTGILLDVPWLESLAAELAGRIVQLEKEIFALAGEEFNINSPKQLGEILFDKLQLPSSKKTKKTKSYSTGVEVLESLAPLYPLPARILDYRQLTKLKSTYVDALPPLVNPATGRLHTTFNQTVAATGRLSSTNPNLQNIPIRTEEGQKIRRAFVAPSGWRLVSADYSQIELRIMAHLSGDELLLAAFRSGQDVHSQTARDVFGAAAEANPSEYRRRAKIINYSILYGKSDFGLAQDLKIPQREAKAFIQSYFATYPGVRRWLDENLADAASSGAVRTMFGRIRPIPELRHSNWNVRSTGERIAANSPIQGAAADIIKLAMIRLARRLEGSGLQARLLLQVHDELLLECPAEEVDRLRGILREAMEDVAPLKVPLVVDIHDGANWLEAK